MLFILSNGLISFFNVHFIMLFYFIQYKNISLYWFGYSLYLFLVVIRNLINGIEEDFSKNRNHG